MKYLYNWTFHFNTHIDKWSGFHREDHDAYWNGEKSKHQIFRATSLSDVLAKVEVYERLKERNTEGST
jgi:hypothetical protein